MDLIAFVGAYRGIWLQVPYDIGISFTDMWAAAVGFMGGDMLRPLVMAMGGFLIAILAIKRLIDLVWGGR